MLCCIKVTAGFDEMAQVLASILLESAKYACSQLSMATDPCDWSRVSLVLCELPGLGQGELKGADAA